jgi:hypothetical protein
VSRWGQERRKGKSAGREKREGRERREERKKRAARETTRDGRLPTRRAQSPPNPITAGG